MTLITAIVIGVLTGAGIHAMSHRDLIKLAGGTLLIGNAAVLFLMAAAFRGEEPAILPVEDPSAVADPLVQALALTAVVISFGTTVLLLRVALSVEETHGTVIMDELAEAEAEDEAEEEERSEAQGQQGPPE